MKKLIKMAGLSKFAFKVAVFAYRVFHMVPRFDSIKGVDTDKLIANVNEGKKV